MKLNKSQIFNLTVFTIGTVIIISLIKRIGWEQTRAQLNIFGWSFLWLFPIYFITMVGDTVSWRLLIRKPVSFFKIVMVANSGTAINALTPSGDGGEFVKGNLIKDDIGGPESVSSLLLWNFVYSVTKKIVLVAGPVLYLIFGPFSMDPRPIGTRLAWGFLIAGIVTSVHLPLLYLLFRFYGVEKSAAFIHKLPILRCLDTDKVMGFAKQIDEAFRAFASEHLFRLFLSGLLLLVAHLSVCFEIWYVLRILGMKIHPVTSIFLFAGSALLQTIVSFSPVEMGVTEAGSMGLYKMMGFDPVYGFLQEFIRRLRRLFFNVIGLVYLGWCTFKSVKRTETPETLESRGEKNDIP
ncbi:MAG: flippase-like domain-containing protein [Deltaproteobacteria bacterium]|nr:flippase-like domain-containing protein [Deltaproteobacteria bacterium]